MPKPDSLQPHPHPHPHPLPGSALHPATRPGRSLPLHPRLVTLATAWLALHLTPLAAEVLWQIGSTDQRNAEFALAPQGYQSFKDDGYFVVGRSDPRLDWPYVHPGPSDAWAGGRTHSFHIEFALRSVPPQGLCQLQLHLLDTHASAPPRFRAEINGQRFETQLPRGAGDASVYGDPTRGKPHAWTVEFPASLLRVDRNEIALTTTSGSWALYDSVQLVAPEGTQLSPDPTGTPLRLTRVETPPVWLRRGNNSVQPIEVTLRYSGTNTTAVLHLGSREAARIRLTKPGLHRLTLDAPAQEQSQTLSLELSDGREPADATNITLHPPKIREVWILPHSHVDVGYTHPQDEIVRIQIENLRQAMKLAQASATNAPGLQFKWNPEAIWALDHFLRQANPDEQSALLAAVRRGDIGIDALYGNMLTGLCRPEELARSLAYGPTFAALTGVPVESASICDVPGWTWGIVPTMAQAGVKYFAIGPNHSARIGSIHRWDNRPFYWKSQSGLDRVLCWIVDNYHHLGDLEQHVRAHSRALNDGDFPYDMTFLYWVGTWPDGGVDNAPPDAATVFKAQQWNRRYTAPRVRIGLAGEFFREFERRHGTRVPEFAGDLTPYWEDGAGSTAHETALNRASAERLSQAETLFALRHPELRPAAAIEEAWKNVLLYSEHTWGAHNSISQPDLPFVTNQWRVKQAFALDADRQSRDILRLASNPNPNPKPNPGPNSDPTPDRLEIVNTTQWPRTELVRIPADLAPPHFLGVADAQGRPLPSQRLASGELAFLAHDVPPFAAQRIQLRSTPPAHPAPPHPTFEGSRLRTSRLHLDLDPQSGAIRSLRRTDLDHEFVDPAAAVALNDYRYVLGADTNAAQPNGAVHLAVVDPGPLVFTLRLTSDAPGCRQLVREVRVVEGLDHLELLNRVDRLPVRAKDSVHFGFGFHVPAATVRMETPWGVVRPNADQLPGACRNWFTVQRWIDVSNADLGILWMPVDAPLVQIGAMTANLMGEVRLEQWLDRAPESATLYSWAQNNHWFTNYKADQPGVTEFRYRLRPHAGGYSPANAARAGLESIRPLLVTRPEPTPFPTEPRLRLSEPDVLVETFKPSEDGRALVLRLFGVSGQPRALRLLWSPTPPASLTQTDLGEKPLRPLPANQPIDVPGYGIVSLRAEWPRP